MHNIVLAIYLIIAYFLGNISPSTVLARRAGVDIKKEGSGNAGTTNALRVLGKKAALTTLVIDVGKGVLAVFFGRILLSIMGMELTKDEPNTYIMICGLAVFLGHILPALYGFKGGKGVATAFGVILAYHWQVALICLGIVVIIVVLSRMVSLGSIIAALIFLPIEYITSGYFGKPYFSQFFFLFTHWPFVLMVIFLVLKHRENIVRIFRGEENRISFSK